MRIAPHERQLLEPDLETLLTPDGLDLAQQSPVGRLAADGFTGAPWGCTDVGVDVRLRTRRNLIERDDDGGTWNLAQRTAQLALDGGDHLAKTLKWILLIVARACRDDGNSFG